MHALRKFQNESVFNPDKNVLLYLTGNAMKYFDAFEIERDQIPMLNRDAKSLASSSGHACLNALHHCEILMKTISLSSREPDSSLSLSRYP